MHRFEELEAFVAVVEAGSFTQAAERLGVAKSAVSRRVSALEARLGVELLRRTTRRLDLTDTGRGFYERSARILADLDEADESTGAIMPPELVFSFTAAAYIGVISWWVEQDCPGSPAEVAAHLSTLTLQGPYRALGLVPMAVIPALAARTALGRIGEPDDIGRVIAALLSAVLELLLATVRVGGHLVGVSVLLAIVLHSGSRRRVLLVGGVFLAVTAAMYAVYVAGVYSGALNNGGERIELIAWDDQTISLLRGPWGSERGDPIVVARDEAEPDGLDVVIDGELQVVVAGLEQQGVTPVSEFGTRLRRPRPQSLNIARIQAARRYPADLILEIARDVTIVVREVPGAQVAAEAGVGHEACIGVKAQRGDDAAAAVECRESLAAGHVPDP